jgi:aminopeptidase N
VKEGRIMHALPIVTPQLSHDEAKGRAEVISKVNSYQIVLDVTDGNGRPGQGTFRSTTTVEFDAKPGAHTFIDLIAGEVKSAKLNDHEIDASDVQKIGRIQLAELSAHNRLVVDAICCYSDSGEGLHRFVDPNDNDKVYLYSQFEPADARRVFACFDQPDLKSEFDLTVTAPAKWQVISNATSEFRPEGASVQHTFATTKRMSTYLVALIAGPYASWSDTYSDEFGTIPLRIFCRESLSDFMDHGAVFKLTKQALAFFHKQFRLPYPFGKYDQLFVPQFNYQGMENVGAVVLNEDQIFRGKVTRTAYAKRADTVVHELAHMWFGDLVTMKWWNDLWLNESFATYASYWCQFNATEFTEAWTIFANTEKAKAYRQDEMPTTHPVIADVNNLADALNNFDGITYRKGASVLKQLVEHVGEGSFLRGLQDYFRAHEFENATFDDLRGALEKASGVELSDWGRQWLGTKGINTLHADFDVDTDGKFTRFAVTQSKAEPFDGETRSHQVAIGIYDDNAGRLVRVHGPEKWTVEGERTDIPALVGVPRGQLVLVNDDDLTYCSQRLDRHSLQTVRSRIGDIVDPLARTLAWSTLWEMTRSAELRARGYVDQVANCVQAEAKVTVAEQLLVQAQTSLRYYAEAKWARDQGWARFADRLLKLARDATPGSDSQLAYINALTASVLSPRHTDVLHALLSIDSDELGLPGLQVDADLRWRIVIALATAGVIDADGTESPVINAEAERDPSDQGRRNAEQAKASRPQTAVKEAAWQRLTTDSDITYSAARAITAGFGSPGQEDLLRRYTSRYFVTILPLWDNRSPEVRKTLATNLYPSWNVRQSAIDAADTFLSGNVPSALDRIVREGQAEVKRSLAARDFDVQVDAGNDK